MIENTPRPESETGLVGIQDYCTIVATSDDMAAIESIGDLLDGVLYKPDDADLKGDHIKLLIARLEKYSEERIGAGLDSEYQVDPKTFMSLDLRRITTLGHVWRASVQGGIQPVENFAAIL